MSVDPGTIRQGCILTSPTLPEPIEVLATVPMGDSLKVIGRGCTTGLTHDPVPSRAQLADVRVSADREPFDGLASTCFYLQWDRDRYRFGLSPIDTGTR